MKKEKLYGYLMWFMILGKVLIFSAGLNVEASSYDVVVGDYDWQTASTLCAEKGGHLATIDSWDEFYIITGMLENNEFWRGKVFYLGGKREEGSPDFYWVDSSGRYYGTSLVDPSNWASGAWGPNEPSYTSGGYEETVCSIFKYQGQWILNDEPLNMLWTAPEYSGIIGYICEYDAPEPYSVAEENSAVKAPYGSDYGGSGGESIAGSGYASVYAGAFEDAKMKHNSYPFEMENYSWLGYSLFDITGDGIKELVFWQVTSKHAILFWVYSTDGNSWWYMGEIAHDADWDCVYGYENGILYRSSYKGYVSLYHAVWNGSSFEVRELGNTLYDRSVEPPSMETLASWGWYDSTHIIEKAPEFIDFNDKSYIESISVYPSIDENAYSGTNSEESSISDVFPLDFTFTSGAGAWNTLLAINDDWAFTGYYHDSELGSQGPGYTSTVFVCSFEGGFSEPEQLSPNEWRFQLASLQQEQQEGQEWIENEVRYIGAEAYGISGGENFILYLPGTPLNEMTEECRGWIRSAMSVSFRGVTNLPDGYYVLYNVNTGATFISGSQTY